MFKRKERFADAVIIGEEQVSLHALQKKAKRANRKFWGLSASIAMVSSMVLPYMSYAASVADSTISGVFNYTVAPGYSMGGVELTAYGVDLNEWGKISRDTAVKSNYGVWSGSRGDSAKKALTASSEVVMLDSDDSANNELTAGEKTQGWEIITGRAAYTADSPNGVDDRTRSQLDSVAPYRTTSDYNFWDSQIPNSNGAASADVHVSLFADFIIVSVDEGGKAQVLTNPDDIASTEGAADTNKALYSNDGMSIKDTTGGNTSRNAAIPYYVPLSAIFDKFGINDAEHANISELMNRIAEDSNAAGTLGEVALKSNLLLGTEYAPQNSNNGETSDAFNPYPYTMVFTKKTDNGTVVSSMYENSEAYVYFAPSVVYAKYMALKEEYEDLYASYKSELQKSPQDAIVTFRLGYYLAEMAILEAYLNEALPQDMTRGYVGASEPRGLSNNDEKSTVNIGGTSVSAFTSLSNDQLKQQTYSTLMYNVAKLMPEDKSDLPWRQSETNAIMDVLSVFGYEGSPSPTNKTGVMAGMNVCQTKYRTTIFNAYERYSNRQDVTNNSTEKTNVFQALGTDSASVDKDEAIMRSAGMYTPTYFPVQQHKMPDAEKAYRFQILSVLPYETLTSYIKEYKFASNVNFIFSTEEGNDIESFSSISEARNRNQALAQQYELAEGMGYDPDKIASLSSVSDSLGSLISLGGSGGDSSQSSIDENGNTQTGSYANGVTLERIDAALLGYEASAMTSDNVHDLFDIVRGTGCLRHETWIRYYNPIKSEGGDNDLFLTRISPAVTTYFPDVLVNGYMPAGGASVENMYSPQNVSFDYFSIPSFAPCFAAHTAEDTYYGVLNYELRAFYSSGFTKVLSENANIPAVGAYEDLLAALNDLKKGQAQEGVTIDKNLAALYVMGKRLAYINTVKYICANKAWAGDALVDWAEKHDVLLQAANEATDPDKKIADAENPSSDFASAIKSAYEELKGKTWISDQIKGLSEVKALGDLFNGAALESVPSDTYGNLPDTDANPFNKDWFEDLFSGEESAQYPTLKRQDDENTTKKFSANALFNVIYDQELDKLLGPNGTYFWEPMDGIKTMMENGVTPTTEEGLPEYDEREYNKYSVCFKGSIWNHFSSALNTPGGKLLTGAVAIGGAVAGGPVGIAVAAAGIAGATAEDGNQDFSDAELAEAYTAQMDACAANLGIAVENLAKDAQLLTNSMPTTMQNCLAWADYQNATDSDNQYQSNPADANVTINLSVDATDGEYDPTKIKKSADLQKYGMKYGKDESGNPVVTSSGGDDESSSIDGRIERGVEGSTWTATIQPAVYTMSATLSRINTMSSQTGTAYPYSGLVNGRLESGTDRYALLQAHVIDYSSIASGIEGDLATRQRAKVVSLVEPQYASLTDFVDNIGNLGALFGEAASGMVKESSTAFSTVSTSNSASSSSPMTSSNMNSSSAAARSYTLSDGTVMNRKPASLATFNPNTGKLEYGTVVDLDSGYGASTAALASGSSAGGQAMSGLGSILIGPMSGIYAMLQSLGLMLVLIFIAVIGFRNFYAYSIANNHQMITAQTELKTVMWRSIIAVFMIGLPPLAAGGQGFEGGNYLLLQIISNVVTYISDIFQSGAFTSLMTIHLGQSFGFNIALWLLYFVCAAVMAMGYGLGCIVIFFQSLCLFMFYLLGPIVWSFYVWPYNDTTAPQKENKFNLTHKLGLSLYSGGKVGNLAPYGHVMNFIVISGLAIVWAIIFWVISQVFIIGSGVTYDESSGAFAAGYGSNAEANAAIPLLLVVFGVVGGDSGFGAWAALRMIFTTVICFILFIVMLIMMIKALKKATENQRGILSGTAHGIAEGAKKGLAAASTAASVVGAGKDLAEGMGIDTAAKAKDFKEKLQGAGKALSKARDAAKHPGRTLNSAAAAAQRAGRQLGDGLKNADPAATAKKLKEAGSKVGKSALESAKDAAKHPLQSLVDADKHARATLKGAMKNLASNGAQGMKNLMKKYDMMDENGTPDFHKLAEATGMMSKFAGGLADGGLRGGAATLAQLAAARRNKDLAKELDLAETNAADAQEAKEMAKKILDGNASKEDLAGLSAGARKALQQGKILDEDGEISKTAKSAMGTDAAADKKRQLLQKIQDNNVKRTTMKIGEVQQKQKQLADGLSGLGLEGTKEVQSAVKTLNGMHTADDLKEVMDKFHLADNEEGRATARAYLADKNSTSSKQLENDVKAIEQWQRMHNAMHPDEQMSYDAAKKFFQERPAMSNLSAAAGSNKSQGDKVAALRSSINEMMSSVPDEARRNSALAAALIEDAYDCKIPELSTYSQLYQKFQSGENMSMRDMQQLTAFQAYQRLMENNNMHPAAAAVNLRPQVQMYDTAAAIDNDTCKTMYATLGENGMVTGLDPSKLHYAQNEYGMTGQDLAVDIRQQLSEYCRDMNLPPDAAQQVLDSFATSTLTKKGTSCQSVMSSVMGQVKDLLTNLGEERTIQRDVPAEIPGIKEVSGVVNNVVRSALGGIASDQFNSVAELGAFLKQQLLAEPDLQSLNLNDDSASKLVDSMGILDAVSSQEQTEEAIRYLDTISQDGNKTLIKKVSNLDAHTESETLDAAMSAEQLAQLQEALYLMGGQAAHRAYCANQQASLQFKLDIDDEIKASPLAGMAALDFLLEAYPTEAKALKEQFAGVDPSYNELLATKPADVSDEVWNDMLSAVIGHEQEIFERPEVLAASTTINVNPELHEAYLEHKLGSKDSVISDLSGLGQDPLGVVKHELENIGLSNQLKGFIGRYTQEDPSDVVLDKFDYEMYSIASMHGSEGLQQVAANCSRQIQAFDSRVMRKLGSGTAGSMFQALSDSEKAELMTVITQGSPVEESEIVQRMAQQDVRSAHGVCQVLSRISDASPDFAEAYNAMTSRYAASIKWANCMEQGGFEIDPYYNDQDKRAQRRAENKTAPRRGNLSRDHSGTMSKARSKTKGVRKPRS